MQVELGFLLYQTGRIGESEAMLRRAWTPQPAWRNAASRRGRSFTSSRAAALRSRGRLGEIVPIAEEAIRTFEQLDDPRGLAAAENLLGHALGREGRTEEATAALERALAHAEAAGDRVMRRQPSGRSRIGSATARRRSARRSTARRAPTLDPGRPRAGCRTAPCLALLLAMAGRFDEAREHILASDPVLDRADQSRSR